MMLKSQEIFYDRDIQFQYFAIDIFMRGAALSLCDRGLCSVLEVTYNINICEMYHHRDTSHIILTMIIS